MHASYAIHMHASHHPLTLTDIALTPRTLHRPRGLTSPDTRSPARHASQAYRPSQGRRKAAIEGCWGGCHGGWSGRCSGRTSLQARARSISRRHRVTQHRRRARGTLATARSAQGGRATALLASPARRPRGLVSPAARGAPCGPESAWGGQRRAGPWCLATLGPAETSGHHSVGRWWPW